MVTGKSSFSHCFSSSLVRSDLLVVFKIRYYKQYNELEFQVTGVHKLMD